MDFFDKHDKKQVQVQEVQICLQTVQYHPYYWLENQWPRQYSDFIGCINVLYVAIVPLDDKQAVAQFSPESIES